jgi:hypothetical protein
VETIKPFIVISVFHADGGLKKESDQRFVIDRRGTKLWIDLIEPKEVESAIAVNTVTAPGPPGSVDKGEQQERGQKLLISTRRALTTTNFVLRLRVENSKTSLR